MSNFEYIISSLPYLTADFKYEDGQGFQSTLEQIRENLSEKDAAVMDFLLSGFDAHVLGPDFYARALAHPLRFVREYFRFDLNLRNAKVRYLNRELGRPDEVTWDKIGSLETFHYFDLTAVLAYVAKLHIVNRWLALDQEKGRELFRQLVSEVRGTFKGVKYTE